MIFTVDNSDGDTCVRMYTEEEFTRKLNAGDFGDPQFLSDIRRSDTNYWSGRTLIIKGEIVVPEPKKTVTEWEIK